MFSRLPIHLEVQALHHNTVLRHLLFHSWHVQVLPESPTAGMEFRGIPAQVHEASYRFLFFWLLSAKMGTKIVRVATLSIYNP